MPTFQVEAMVRGYHVYEEIWDASIGEELLCAREPTNPRDPFAVAVVKSDQTVGHVPLKISSVCSLFLRHGGTIMCKITKRRRHSKNLTQGGLEIPCTLTFGGGSKDIAKVEKLIKKSLATPAKQEETPADMKRPSEHACEDEPSGKKTRTWIDQDVDAETIHNGEKLTDCHVGFAQQLLKRQFPHLQVIHSCGDHWVLALNIGCANGDVNVYDSVYRSLDKVTIAVITTISVISCQDRQITKAEAWN